MSFYHRMGEVPRKRHTTFYKPNGEFYRERDVRLPQRLATHVESGDFEVRVKRQSAVYSYFFDFHPFDVVGWDGYLYPYALSIHDFEPITGRIHQPPPVHQTFAGQNFVICSFVPRLYDYHPQSIPAPYFHSNVESDEVLYYVRGNFMSRKGIYEGSITLHPMGIPHGPHPGKIEGSIGKKETSELAVMLDTFRPLKVTRQALEVEDGALRKPGGVRKDTARNIQETGEFVVNMVDVHNVDVMNLTSADYPPEVSEAAALGLALLPSAAVKVPRLGASRIHFECRLHQIVELGEPASSDLIIGEVVHVHVEDALYHRGRIDAEAFAPVSRLAGHNYTTLGEVFDRPRPIYDPSKEK